MGRSLRITIIVMIFSVLTFGLPIHPLAHESIIKSNPAENQVLSNFPKKVSVQFDEEIQPDFSSIKVFDMNGKQVDLGNSHLDSINKAIIECELKPNLPNGTYRINWKVVASDGHPGEGVIPFGVGNVGGEQTILKSSTKLYYPTFNLVLLRGIQFVSGSFLVGLLFFYLFVLRSPLSPILSQRYNKAIFYSFWVLFFSMILNLPLQITVETGVTWKQAFNLSLLINILKNSFFGKVWIVQIVLLFALNYSAMILKPAKDEKIRNWKTSFFLGCSFLLTKSLTSHGYTTDHSIFTLILDFVHLLGAFVWTGSILAMIVLLPMNRSDEGKANFKLMIRNFFNWGVLFVLLIATTGILRSLSTIPTVDSLYTTIYGRILLAKVSLFIVMLVFSIINFIKGKSTSDKQWGFSLKSELIISLFILFLAVILTNVPTATSAPSPFIETRSLNNEERVTLKIDPRVVGTNHFDVTIKDKQGNASKNFQQVRLTIKYLDTGGGELIAVLPQVSNGHFYSQGSNINKPGHWEIIVHLLKRNYETLDLNYSFTVGRNN